MTHAMGAQRLPTLEFARLRADKVSGLLSLLSALEVSGESSLFSPHPFTSSHVESLCGEDQLDLYYVAHEAGNVLAYGLLRGWGEGYAVPSLGIATHPEHRGRGIAAAMMAFLHAAASIRGAQQVRLRVHAVNGRAIRLYQNQGYVFAPDADADGLMVAYKSLSR